MKMNQCMLPPLKPGDQLWGIYYTDRESARLTGDPMLGIVAAPTKAAAEEIAVKAGLPDAWASPLTADQIQSIRQSAPRPAEQSRITAQPTAAELLTAIEILKALDHRLNDHAAHSVMQLPETELGDRYAAHIEAQAIKRSSHLEKVVGQLQNWREELSQEQNHQVTQSV